MMETIATQPVAKLSGITLIATGGNARSPLHKHLTEIGHPVAETDPAVFIGGGDVCEAALLVIEEGGDTVDQSARLLTVLARVGAAAADRQVPLWVVTTGAQQPAAAGEGLVGAAVWGLGRVLFNEMPRLPLHLLDVPATASAVERADIAAELAAATPETEIVWTPRVAMCRGCAAGCRRAGRAGCGRRSTRDQPGGSTALLAADRPDRRDRARSRSRCGRRASISAT